MSYDENFEEIEEQRKPDYTPMKWLAGLLAFLFILAAIAAGVAVFFQ